MTAAAAGGYPGKVGVRHPVDLPEGYHPAAQEAELYDVTAGCVEGCPRAAARSGDARSTGCRTSPGVVRRARADQRECG